FDRCGDKAEFFPYIMTATFKFIGKDTLNLIEFGDRISELDFTACTNLLFIEETENFRCQYVTTDDREIGWCGSLRRFFHKTFYFIKSASIIQWFNHAITMRFFLRSEEHTSELQ